jgi:hypothetical protein
MIKKRFSGVLAVVVIGLAILLGQPTGAQTSLDFPMGLPNPFSSAMPCFCCQMTGRCSYCQGSGESPLGPCTVCSRTGTCTMCRGLGQVLAPPPGSGFSTPSIEGGSGVPTRGDTVCGMCRGTGSCIVCRGTRHRLHYGIRCDAPCCGGCNATGICTNCDGRGRR